GDQQDGGKTSPPPPPPLAGTGGQPTELRKTAEGTLVCQRERSDLIGSYLEVSIAHPTDPVERALLLAWLEGATAQALTPRETPPCTSGQLCGRLQEGAAADVIQALLHPPLGRFYQT